MITSFRHVSRAMVSGAAICFAICFAICLAIDDAAAAERKFETPIGMIVIDTDPAWKDLRPVPGSVNGVAFESGKGESAMQLVLATVEEAGQNVDAQTVRKLAEETRKSEVAGGLRVSDLKSFTDSKLTAFYYEGTGPTGAKPKPGEFERMIAGYIYTNSFPLVFTIAWNDGGKAAADRALDAVKRLSISGR